MGFLKLGQKYKNIFVGFLVQIKTLKFASEINLPLDTWLSSNGDCIYGDCNFHRCNFIMYLFVIILKIHLPD